ncbi:hypothetical protein HN873_036145, partial [Arachis hypogaea]
LFFGCYYLTNNCQCELHTSQQHCKYFKWLDEMIGQNVYSNLEDANIGGEKSVVEGKLIIVFLFYGDILEFKKWCYVNV